MIYWVLGELQRRRCDVTNELSFEYQRYPIITGCNVPLLSNSPLLTMIHCCQPLLSSKLTIIMVKQWLITINHYHSPFLTIINHY
jgi:hypothetical protein